MTDTRTTPPREAPPGARPAAGRRRGALRTYWPHYLAISPFYVLFLVFGLVPVLFSLYLAFQRWDGIGDMQFVGLRNFEFLVKDSTFWLSLYNTFVIWIMSTVPMLFLALVLAVLLNSKVRFTSVYRIAYFIPNVTSLVAIAIVFGAVFSTNQGLINAILGSLHIGAVPWLSNEWTIKLVIASLITWQWTGYNAILYLAGLQAIPTEMYEAAKIDGAGPVQTFFRITVPQLRPIILFTVVVSTINGMQTFTEPQVLFGGNASINPNSGGPGQAGLTAILYFYREAFSNNDYGYGAAIAWAVFVVILLFTAINWRLVQRRDKGAA
ncbi:cytochrome c biogenesis protein [Planotetraspora silvatica]|uniref:Cytochrome c biogenesis protein n=1 Tax=Planotetraspora silvatica TaxID=234614 RepID=A0A8J3XMK9_9ACTN|nr:sugar ABC transporter permease [Planotetraspora silvatica]GII46624.1 cytochrome c biogenesis protein [Planotetraspora silvatica]